MSNYLSDQADRFIYLADWGNLEYQQICRNLLMITKSNIDLIPLYTM